MDAKRIVFVGPPGSGKGTQAAIVAKHLGIPAISTGDMLRQAVAAATELGSRVEAIMNEGQLVDDDTMAEVVRSRLEQEDAQQGFLLDGYPRTQVQVENLASILAERKDALDVVISITVPEDELARRMLARKRADDTEETIRRRIEVYREDTEPLIGYYGQLGLLREVDGFRDIEAVTEQILRVTT